MYQSETTTLESSVLWRVTDFHLARKSNHFFSAIVLLNHSSVAKALFFPNIFSLFGSMTLRISPDSPLTTWINPFLQPLSEVYMFSFVQISCLFPCMILHEHSSRPGYQSINVSQPLLYGLEPWPRGMFVRYHTRLSRETGKRSQPHLLIGLPLWLSR